MMLAWDVANVGCAVCTMIAYSGAHSAPYLMNHTSPFIFSGWLELRNLSA